MGNSPSRLFPSSVLFLAALTPRIAYLYEHRESPFFISPIVDAKTFIEKAQLIAGGELWGGAEPYWQPPLYIYLLSFIIWLLPSTYWVGIRLLQSVLGAFSCVLIYALARRIFGERVGRIAGGMAAICGSFLYFEGELLSTTVEITLNLLLLYQICSALDTRQRSKWIIAGILSGLSALTRPNILLFIGVFCSWLGWRQWRNADHISRSTPIWFIVPIALVILPITWRNWNTEPDLVFISSNGGINFYIGNNLNYEQTVSLRPGMQWDHMVMEPVRAGHTTAAAKSSFFMHKGLHYITENPVEAFGLFLKKGYHTLAGPEIKRNQNIYYAREQSWILSLLLWNWHLSIPFGVIGPLSLLGLGVNMTKRIPAIYILRLYTICYLISIVLFFPAARYRMPVLPVLIVFAASAIWHLSLSIRSRSWSRTMLLAGPLSGLLIIFNLTQAAPSAEDPQLWFDLGEVHLRNGEYPLAADYSRRALALDPHYNYARHNLALAYFHQDEFAKSEQEALSALAENPLRIDTRVLLGKIYLATQRPKRAETFLRQALDRDPGSAVAHYFYGRLLYAQKRFTTAVTHLQKAQIGQPRSFSLHYDLGRALQQAGRSNEALTEFQQALELEKRPQAHVAIGASYLLLGRSQEAHRQFVRALEIDSENPEAHINLALLDIQDGHLHKAIDRLHKVLQRHPSPQAQRLLEEAYRQKTNDQ